MPLPQHSQLFTDNLQGRMSSVVNEGYTDGTLSSRERTSYEYDSKSYRAALVNEVDSALNNTYTLTSSTEFLADHHNHTGYTQTIRETTTNADGTTKTIDYTFGLDEISQRVVERDDQGAITGNTSAPAGTTQPAANSIGSTRSPATFRTHRACTNMHTCMVTQYKISTQRANSLQAPQV